MILGLGNDLVDIRRIERSIERFGQRFLDRVFTAGEQAKAGLRSARPRSFASTLAKRFAAKEAMAKALGTGFSQGMVMREIEVVSAASGQPQILVHGMAGQILNRQIPPGFSASILLTMTDEYPYAQAIVLIQIFPSSVRIVEK